MKALLPFLVVSLLALPQTALAAIGCTLSSPAEDLKVLFPQMTTYREDLKELPRLKDGPAVWKDLRERLGSDLDPIYETFEIPYTVYTVFLGPKKIGIVHGVNVPGRGGVIQVFLSVDPETTAIRRFFFQRLDSPAARALRTREFGQQFEGLTLADFYKHDYYAKVAGTTADKVGSIRPPDLADAGRTDYSATLRGVRKNLILLDLLVFDRRSEPFFTRARAASKARGAAAKD